MDRHYIVTAKSDVGMIKNVNQDSLTFKVAKTPLGEVVFAVLCDGMGGLSFGELASSHVIKAFQLWYEQGLKAWIESGMDKQTLFFQWKKIIEGCNTQILRYGEKEKTKLGTTATILLLANNNYYVANVGDGRLYELGDTITQITKDQTFVVREVELGHMTEIEAKNDSRKNVLLQCIGVNEEVVPDYFYGVIKENSSFLVCSDGFRHVVNDEEILCHCKLNLSEYSLKNKLRDEIHDAMNKELEYLIELNKNRGEQDNISAILVMSSK